MISVPSELGKWSIANLGDIFGSLFTTRNVHFDDGHLNLSPKAASLFSSHVNVDFGLLMAALFFENDYLLVTDQEVWELRSGLNMVCISDGESNAPHPNGASDAVVWQERAYVSSDTSTDVRYWNGTAWTNPSISLSETSKPHPLAVMGNFSGGHLVVGETNTVRRYDTSHSLIVTLTLNANYEVTKLLYRQNYLYIMTRAIDGGEAKCFVWNGSGTSAQQEYGCGSNWIFSACEYGNGFAIVTNKGQVLKWNGAGFDTENPMAEFPVANSPYQWNSTVDSSPVGKVQMNGMKANGKRLYINVDGSVANYTRLGNSANSNSFYLPNQPSGIWCYDPAVGLYPRNLSTSDGYTVYVPSNPAGNEFTLDSDAKFVTGEPVYVADQGSLTGLIEGVTYFAIVTGGDTIKLADTRADAFAGNDIDVGGTAGDAEFYALDYDQYGEEYGFSVDAGAMCIVVAEAGSPGNIPSLFKTPYIWGFQTATDDATHLCALTLGSNVGSFTLPRVFSLNLGESWGKMGIRILNLFSPTDKIVIKTRQKDKQDYPTPPFEGTFSNETTIGSGDGGRELIEEGEEVNILTGAGAGLSSHIKEKNGDEYLLEDTYPHAVAADAIVFNVENWERKQVVDIETESISSGYVEVGFDKPSQWMQAKIEMRGFGLKIPQLLIDNAPFKP